MSLHQQYIDDKTAHPALKYMFDLGDGYTGRCSRGPYGAWNGYVEVPDNHWATHKEWDEFEDSPIEITFARNRTIGFDHCHSEDYQPQSPDILLPYPYPHYTTYEEVVKEIETLAKYLKYSDGFESDCELVEGLAVLENE